MGSIILLISNYRQFWETSGLRALNILIFQIASEEFHRLRLIMDVMINLPPSMESAATCDESHRLYCVFSNEFSLQVSFSGLWQVLSTRHLLNVRSIDILLENDMTAHRNVLQVTEELWSNTKRSPKFLRHLMVSRLVSWGIGLYTILICGLLISLLLCRQINRLTLIFVKSQRLQQMTVKTLKIWSHDQNNENALNDFTGTQIAHYSTVS